MARNNVTVKNITGIYTVQRWFEYCRILALFVALHCNASLPLVVSAVGNRVDSSTETVAEGVGLPAVGGVNGIPERSAYILPPPHVFRHQEHYSQRTEQNVNDFKRTQLYKQPSENYSNSIPKTVNSSDNSGNKYIHLLSQSEPQISEHLHRHSHRHSSSPASVWERYVLPPLRHQRHQQLQPHHHRQEAAAAKPVMVTSSPSIHLIVPTATEAAVGGVVVATTNEDVKIASSSISTTNSSSEAQHMKPHRYFDRDGLYQSPYLWTTKGPKVRGDKNGWLEKDFAGMRFYNRRQTDSQRISLNLNAGSDDGSPTRKDSAYKKVEDTDSSETKSNTNTGTFVGENYGSQVAEDEVDNSSEYDDYSYGDSVEESVSANELPDASDMQDGEHRATVKRFTNPFKDFRVPQKERDYPHSYSAMRRRIARDRDGDDSKTNSNFGADSDNNSDADFSSEKWQRIEQEHHRKQQEHQQKMLALRSRHDDYYRFTEATATTESVSVAAAAPKEQRYIDDEDADNINSQHYVPGTLTQQKQEELGTLAAVQESRRSHVNIHKHEKALASEHVKQILKEAACRVPQRHVERIQRDPSKMYMPHCTVLHRCTDETGCCRSERQTCAPKRTKNVELYFYVRSINEKRGTVERLTFINHTECHCVERSRQQADEYHNLPLYGISYGGQSLRRATILNCNCPKLYEKILQEDGFCRCDCSSGNTGCDWLKRGMEHFSMIDRKCMSEGRCKPPTCEHGPYIKKYGRCPRREEQLSAAVTGPVMLATNALSGNGYH
ncbi:uncharacterized protein LOC129246880 [Anastrepha obliqua]|uniref:uncharacterized protein LOC129246880 n=1 Tax=Anastrepha obliqua TaxID=95512 RepID=UPI002409B0CC|nr:uncharacterized protein LOC129246880 [Anastrepha obliqua]